MLDFNFISPTKIYFGKDKENLIGSICNEYNFKKVFIVLGRGSARKSGLLDRVTVSLDKNDIKYVLAEGVRANPTIQFVHDALSKAKEFEPDLILAVGGGSVIDTAKSIANGYYYDGDTFDFNKKLATPKKSLPVGVILTVSASGSELSTSCVIQDDITGYKSGFNSDFNRPLFVIENPELTYTVDQTQTAYGVVDIIMHTLERYLNPSSDNEPSDGFAEGLLKSVIKAARIVKDNPCDYESRAVLMLMSSFSHNDITGLGKKKNMPIHALEHALSGLYPHVAHPAGLAVLFPQWANYYVNYDVDRFDSLARNVFGVNNLNKLENAKKGIKMMTDLFKELNMPSTYKDLGIEDINIDNLVNMFSQNGTRVVDHDRKPLDKDVARIIYSACI